MSADTAATAKSVASAVPVSDTTSAVTTGTSTATTSASTPTITITSGPATARSSNRRNMTTRTASSARSVTSNRSDADSSKPVSSHPFSKPIWSDGSYSEVVRVFRHDEYCIGMALTVVMAIFLFVAIIRSVRTDLDFTTLSLFGVAMSCLVIIPNTRCRRFLSASLLESPANPHVKKGGLAIVTGSNSGIGKATAQQLALWGCDVIMGVRNEKSAKAAKVDIEKHLTAHCRGRECGELTVLSLDLSDLESVKSFASTVLALKRDVHFLINNAGVFTQEMNRTKQGHELMFGTNYLGPYLLSTLLLDNITKVGGRIINVASAGHSFAPRLNLPHISSMDESKFNGLRMYGYSKTAIMLLTRELAHRMSVANSDGVSVSIQPGGVCTSLTRELGFQAIFGIYFKNLWEGSQTTLYCCAESSGKLMSGGYYSKCRPGIYLEESINLDSAKELCAWSEKACANFTL
eukprot:Lankesteria_metandrocarpae@DN8079_c0_g1_i1.p1